MIKRFILRGGLVLLMLAVMVASVLDTQEVRAAGGTTSLIIGGLSYEALANGSDEYNTLSGAYEWSAAFAARKYQVVSTPGTFSSLQVELTGIPGTNPYRITLMKNGVATALYVDIAADGTQATNTSNDVAVVAGDYVYLKSSRPSGNPDNTPSARWSIQFESTNANESIYMRNFTTNAAAVSYTPLSGGGNVSAMAAELQCYQVIPTAGKIKNMYIRLDGAPGAGTSYNFRLRIDGVDTALQANVADAGTTGSDVANEVVVNAGDKVTVAITPVGAPAERKGSVGVTFVANNADEFIILGQSGNQNNNTNVRYSMIATVTGVNGWGYDTVESTQVQNGQKGFVLSDFYVYQQNAPGAGKSFVFDVRNDAGNTGISVEVADAAKTDSDVVNTYKINDDYADLVLKCTPSGTPAVGYTHWGLVGLYDPVSIPTLTTSAATSVTYNSAVGNGNITDTGGENPATRGFCYSTVNNPPTIADSLTNEAGSFGAGAYTLNITGLEEDTVYYVRSYATNSAGTGYGTTQTFTTIIGYPISRVIPLAFIFVGVILLLALVFVDGINIKGLIYIVIIIYALTALLAGINFMVRNLL